MDFEQSFAATVFNAPQTAKALVAAGFPFPRSASDEIDGAITDLCICLQAIGCPNEEIEMIIKRHVVEHRNGTYSPRHRPTKKVVRFRRR